MKIIHKTSGEILFEDSSDSFKETLENAVKGKSNLSGVDLSDANLKGVDLKGLNLDGAYLPCVGLPWPDLPWADLSRMGLRRRTSWWGQLLEEIRGLIHKI